MQDAVFKEADRLLEILSKQAKGAVEPYAEQYIIPEDIKQYINDSAVERWQRGRAYVNDKGKRTCDHLIVYDGETWWREPDCTGCTAEDLQDTSGLFHRPGPQKFRPLDDSKDKPPRQAFIEYGDPGYWLHFTKGPLADRALPVYGYMLDLGYKGAAAPPMQAVSHADWEHAEWLVRCWCCGRELPPIAYTVNNDYNVTTCKDCRALSTVANRINKRPPLRRTYVQQDFLDDYKAIITTLWRNRKCPHDHIAIELFGEEIVWRRFHKSLSRTGSKDTSRAFQKRQTYLEEQKQALYKSKIDMSSLFA